MLTRSSGREYAVFQRCCWPVAVQRPPQWAGEATPPLPGWDFSPGMVGMRAPECPSSGRVVAHRFLVVSSHPALYFAQCNHPEMVKDFLKQKYEVFQVWDVTMYFELAYHSDYQNCSKFHQDWDQWCTCTLSPPWLLESQHNIFSWGSIDCSKPLLSSVLTFSLLSFLFFELSFYVA